MFPIQLVLGTIAFMLHPRNWHFSLTLEPATTSAAHDLSKSWKDICHQGRRLAGLAWKSHILYQVSAMTLFMQNGESTFPSAFQEETLQSTTPCIWMTTILLDFLEHLLCNKLVQLSIYVASTCTSTVETPVVSPLTPGTLRTIDDMILHNQIRVTSSCLVRIGTTLFARTAQLQVALDNHRRSHVTIATELVVRTQSNLYELTHLSSRPQPCLRRHLTSRIQFLVQQFRRTQPPGRQPLTTTSIQQLRKALFIPQTQTVGMP